MDFVIDVTGDVQQDNQPKPQTKVSFVKELLKEYKQDLLTEVKAKKEAKPKSITDAFIVEMGWTGNPNINKKWKKKMKKEVTVTDKSEVKEALAKSVITPDFEKLHAVPRYDVSEKKLKQERQKDREKTKGKKWYGLPATEVTEEVKRDLEIIQMRSVLDPKHFYKKNDLKVLPKYFQIGKVMDSPLDYYNNRLTKKERKKSLVDELLADAEFNKFNKRKYKEIIEEKQKTHYKAWRQAKRLKKKK